MEIKEAEKKHCPIIRDACINERCMFWKTNVWVGKTPTEGSCRLKR